MNASTPSVPLFRVGIISDTHIKETPASCKKLKAALKLFAAEKVDMVINCGDIANVHNVPAYKLYRKIINDVFTTDKPEEIFIHAYHDWTSVNEVDASFKAMQEALAIPHEMLDCKIFKGYTFLIIPQNVSMDVLEEKIASAVKANPDKPVFVIDHIPPFGIFHNGKLWGNKPRHEVLKKFPSVIQISGHIHGSSLDEANIWQGEYTAVNAGCLATWGGDFAAAAPKSKPASEALIMEVFSDKVLFRRYSVITRKEFTHTPCWSVPLPFDPATAPYAPVRRYEASEAPAFSPRAKLKLETVGRKFTFLKLRFPNAAPDVFKYRVQIERKNGDGTFQCTAVTEIPGNFYKALSKQQEPHQCLLTSAYFEKGQTYQLSVIPENFFGKPGAPLSTVWKAPAPAPAEVIFETKDPMTLPFFTELTDGVPVKREGDYYFHDTHNARLELPETIWENIPEGTVLRFIADLHTIQEDTSERSWTMLLRNKEPLENACPRIHTPYGDVHCRYQTEFTPQPGRKYCLLVREGAPAKLKFEYIRIEKVTLSEKTENL